MSEYTPTTEAVRGDYIAIASVPSERMGQPRCSPKEARAEFDEWLRRDRVAQVLFWSKVSFSDACWLWTGTTASNGYGRFRLDGKMRAAHIVAYSWLIGPVPAGLELDHVKAWGCTSRACVNPAHLEPVTHRENTLRGDSFAAIAARKSHCKRGHELAGENLVPSALKAGKRACRTCSRERLKERRNAMRAQ